MEFNCPACGHHLASFDVKPLVVEEVKDDQTEPLYDESFDRDGNLVTRVKEVDVNASTENEPSVTKPPFSGVLTKKSIQEIRKLYEQGYGLARIRQKLKLDISLGRLQTVVNKPW